MRASGPDGLRAPAPEGAALPELAVAAGRARDVSARRDGRRPLRQPAKANPTKTSNPIAGEPRSRSEPIYAIQELAVPWLNMTPPMPKKTAKPPMPSIKDLRNQCIFYIQWSGTNRRV